MVNEKIRLQPLYSMTKGVILGYEALYDKGNEPEYPSAAYILKNIVPICKARGDFKLFINMTVKDVADDNFRKNFLAILSDLGIKGNRIVLELSENTNNELLQQAKITLNILRMHNIEIALDDFGTQNSTLELTRELPIDIVKLDKHFIQYALFSEKWRSLLNFYVTALQDLGCKVVVEGIETPEQLDCVLESKADVGQGFFFSAPSAVDANDNPFIKLDDFVLYLSSGRKAPVLYC